MTRITMPLKNFTATDVYNILKRAEISTEELGDIVCLAYFLVTRDYYRDIEPTDENLKSFIIDVATGEYKNQIPLEQMIPIEYIHISTLYSEAQYLTMSLEQLEHELSELLSRRFSRNCYDKYEYSDLIELCKNEIQKRVADKY